jgi:uncharacterized protein
VILFNLGTDQPVAVTRANLTVFLTVTSLSFVPQLWLQGLLAAHAVWLGVDPVPALCAWHPRGSGDLRSRAGRVLSRRGLRYHRRAGVAGLPVWD